MPGKIIMKRIGGDVMQYIENETTELKANITDELKAEIISFLNSYLGGKIYIGVDGPWLCLKIR